jgi:DNA helicase HerA-like ATPase
MSSVSDQTRVIGRVSSVENELLTIELLSTTPGYVKGGISGIIPVGSVNSYVTMTAGITKVVAVVTSIKVSEAPRGRNDPIASPVRVIEASMIGRITNGQYRPGIATYPALFTPVSAATPLEIAQVFRPKGAANIRFGEAVVQPGQDVILDAESLLTRHCAIVGSTGSGKSCSVMAVLDGLLSHKLPSANIVIFDTNGEYAKAFESSRRKATAVPLVIGGRSDTQVDLSLPHWFMDNAEHLALFRASEGVQGPLLLRSVADARLASEERARLVASALLILRHIEIHDAMRKSTSAQNPQESLSIALPALHKHIIAFRSEHPEGSDDYQFWDRIANVSIRHTELKLAAKAWGQPVPIDQTKIIDEMFRDIKTIAMESLSAAGLSIDDVASDFDAPRYYSLEELVKHWLPSRLDMESFADPRFKQYASGMLLRIGKILADSRYNFFTRVPRFDDALGLFIRLILGWFPLERIDASAPWRDSYDAQHQGAARKHKVIILDLSAVGSDVLEHVAALVARIILGFCQRLEERASLPVLLVLEEAHRYVPPASATAQRTSEVFERIAKEGRKFGVSILLASQRPSELSPTVLAQCGTLIAHRIVSSEDQDIIRHATPFASREILRQLPGLATQHAIVVGDAVPAPTYVRVRDVPDRPRSEDPAFLDVWSAEPSADVGEMIDRTARAWEHQNIMQPNEVLEPPLADIADDFEIPF